MLIDDLIKKSIPKDYYFKAFTIEALKESFRQKIEEHFKDCYKHIIVPVIKYKSVGLDFDDQITFNIDNDYADFIKEYSHHVMSGLSLSKSKEPLTLSHKALENSSMPARPICIVKEGENCNCPFSLNNIYRIKIKNGKDLLEDDDIPKMRGLLSNENAHDCNIEKDLLNNILKRADDIKLKDLSQPKKFFWKKKELQRYIISISFYMNDWKKIVYFPGLFLTYDTEEKLLKRESGLYYQTNRKDSSNIDCSFLFSQFPMFTNIFSLWGTHDNILRHATKSAVTAIMARNFSHNIGSHVLSTVGEDDIRSNPLQVEEFHSYLQKRMDLIARMVGGQYTGGEPMYFIGDVLNGFFKQYLLLNHLVHDQGGFKEDKIQFKICLPDDNNEYIFTYKEKDKTIKDKNGNSVIIKKWVYDNSVKDFLVSIPDGEIGCQAFYLFLESMMRNSAKYGFNKSAGDFQITIKLEEPKNKNNFYKVSIGDNLSLCNGKLAEDIRSKIKEKIVDESGQLSTKSFGIAEMREACRFLIEPFGDEYPAYVVKGEKFPLWVNCPGSKDCHKDNTKRFDCAVNKDCNHLTYTFNLMKPQMVGIVGKDDSNVDLENKKYGIKSLELNDLKSQKCAYQFILIYVNADNRTSIINEIATSHHLLPFRLMLVDDDIGTTGKWPERRWITCSPEEICLDNIGEDDGAERLIISTYEAWIRNRWLKHKCANFVLAFDRDNKDAVFTIYEGIRNIQILSDKVNWRVCRAYFDTGQNNFVIDELPIQKKDNGHKDCCYFVYDNHSCYAKAKNLLNNTTLLFHHNTGDKNKKIFETLASPPYQNVFTFGYFFLGLLEAALTEVIIIDERVAESCIDDNDNYKIDHLKSLTRCRCYPIFYANKKVLNEEVRKKIAGIMKNNKTNLEPLWSLKSNKTSKTSYIKNSEKKISDADFVIIHYGLIETHNALKNFNNLYALAPSIVITSGRGAGTIKKDDKISNLPFLEASILKDNTYPSISKYHLVRALMSIKGGA